MQERRKYRRIKTRLPLKIFWAEADFITETINISPGGVYCQIDKFVPVMTKLKITMFLPTKGKKKSYKISCEGIIVRTEPEYPAQDVKAYNIAIFFSRLKKTDRSKIAEYVKKEIQSNPAWN